MKQTIKKLYTEFEELFKFAINGTICFVIDWSVMMLIMTFTDLPDWFAIASGFIVSVIVNYIICVVWVFKGAGKQSFIQQVVFIGSSVIGLFLTEWLMGYFMMFFNATISKIITTLIVMVFNFIFKRFAIYGLSKNKGKKDS